MRFFNLLVLLSGTLSSCFPTSSSPTSIFQGLSNNKTRGIFDSLSLDDIHATALKDIPANRVLTEDTLHDYLVANPNSTNSVYLKDTREFVTLTPPPSTDFALNKRQETGGNPVICPTSTKTKVLATKLLWYPWQPLSTCQKTGSGGAHIAISQSFALAIQESGGLSWSVIEGATINAGFSVTETWTTTEMDTCDIPEFSVGQRWGRGMFVWAEFQTQTCNTCYADKCDPAWKSWGASPQKGVVDGGCSTGYPAVDCNEY